MQKIIAYAVVLLLCFNLNAQDYFPTNKSVKNQNNTYTALTNATIHVSPTQTIENGTLLIKDGKVVNSGTNINIPKNTNVIDLSGKSIYPSFIDVFTNFGISKPKRATGTRPQYDASRTGYYWNDHIMPEQKGIESFKYDSKKAEALRKLGFGVVNTHMQDGIVRGSGVLVALNSNGSNAHRILDDHSVQYLSFRKSVASRQSYPTSQMGSMALLRQMYLDADWYSKGGSNTKDLSLEALIQNKNLPQIFAAGSKMTALRADKVGDESGVQYVLLGGGDEYERINEIKGTNATFIIPINFRKAYDVENSFLTASLSLGDMKAWNQEPTNPKVLAENNIAFALTTHSLKSEKDFKAKLMEAITYGLDKNQSLRSFNHDSCFNLRKV